MKRILQALDNASTKPVEGANDMKKFLQVVNEGSNPHKVALPVQMAMQHYQQKPPEKKKPKLLEKYFQQVEFEQLEEKEQRQQLIKQYSQTIAERVLMKESVLNEKSTTEKQARTMAAAAHDPEFAKKVGIKQSVAKEFNKADTGTKQLSNAMKHKKKKKVKESTVVEVPIEPSGDPNDPTIYGHEKANPMSLKGRIQQARNQLQNLAHMAQSDDLIVWERICKLAKGGMFMGLEQNLEQIRHGISELAAKRKKGGVQSRGIDKNIG